MLLTKTYEYDALRSATLTRDDTDVNVYVYDYDDYGVSDYGYRYYSPELGRWLTMDPIEEWGGFNLYSFVENNAINQTDFVGLINTTTSDSESGGCCEDKEQEIDDLITDMANQAWEKTASVSDGLHGYAFEYCGLVCCDNQTSEIGDTGLTKGFYKHNGLINVIELNTGKYLGTAACSPKECEQGKTPVGSYHSHPVDHVAIPGPSTADETNAERRRKKCPNFQACVYDPNWPEKDAPIQYY